jgi:hypothetical protein
MTQEEFDHLAANRNKLIANSLVNLLANSSTSKTRHANDLIVDSHHDSNRNNDIPPPAEEEGGV